MRILYASQRPPFPFFLGGAARCTHYLLQGLALEHQVECLAVGSSDYALTPWRAPEPEAHEVLGVKNLTTDGAVTTVDCGYPVHVIPAFLDALPEILDSFRPDVVWSQLEGASEILGIVASKKIQGLLYVHDAESDPADLRTIAARGARFLASSRFLAGKVRRVTGIRPRVAYPACDRFYDTRGDRDGCVTMINPHRVKGIDTFLSIARSLPDEHFLLVESWKLGEDDVAALLWQLREVPNVKFVRRVSDMRTIYAQTKLLLIPSMCEEGFGMVAIEAQSCAIPVIASERGGLAESVGDGGILIKDYRNPDRWLEAIAEVLGNPPVYEQWSERALSHARTERFQPDASAQQFLAVCAEAITPSGTSLLLTSISDRVRNLPIVVRFMRRPR